jgi:hypothetical protein
MRTKTLLIAAAALVAATVSSEAQVYSANVVGYANVVLPGHGATVLIANPFDDGNGNHLSNILSAPIPGGLSQSKIFYYSGGLISVNKTATGWGSDVQLPPGNGFYVQNGKPGANAPALTNTFVGSVIPLAGSSVTNDIPAGYSLQGSTTPYAGNIAIATTSSGDANLNYGGALHSISLGNNSQILWVDPVTAGPQSSTLSVSDKWGNTVPMQVGEGFLIHNVGTDTNMVQTLP